MGSSDNLPNENCQYSSSFSWCHFRLWTTSPGEKADKMDKWHVPSDVRSLLNGSMTVCFLGTGIWHRRRHRPLLKVFRPKKGLSFCLLPRCCPSREKDGSMFPKAGKAPGYGPRIGRGKGGWWGTADPKGRSVLAEERCSPCAGRAPREPNSGRWVLARLRRGLPGFSYSLPKDPLPAMSRDRIFGALLFLQERGSVRQTVFFLPRNPETIGRSEKQRRISRPHIISIDSIAFRGSCFDQNAL